MVTEMLDSEILRSKEIKGTYGIFLHFEDTSKDTAGVGRTEYLDGG